MSWLHQMAGLNPVGASLLVQVTLAGIKRIVVRSKIRKEPVTVEMLQAMVEATGMEPSLTEVRLLAVCLLAFAGFLHCDELINLRCSDISFNAEGMRVSIKSSKTDQYRDRDEMVIARTGTPTCPVNMMTRYFDMARLTVQYSEDVFRGIVHTKEDEKLCKSGGISNTRLRELLLAKIGQLWWVPELFGMHSLRAGGATMATNAGVPDRLFK